jgi:hypothetical protein
MSDIFKCKRVYVSHQCEFGVEPLEVEEPDMLARGEQVAERGYQSAG